MAMKGGQQINGQQGQNTYIIYIYHIIILNFICKKNQGVVPAQSLAHTMLILSRYATLHNEARVVVKRVVTTLNVQAILYKSWSSKISKHLNVPKKSQVNKTEKKTHEKNLDETVFMPSYL